MAKRKIKHSFTMRMGYTNMCSLIDALKLMEGLGIVKFKVDVEYNPSTGNTVLEWEEPADENR